MVHAPSFARFISCRLYFTLLSWLHYDQWNTLSLTAACLHISDEQPNTHTHTPPNSSEQRPAPGSGSDIHTCLFLGVCKRAPSKRASRSRTSWLPRDALVSFAEPECGRRPWIGGRDSSRTGRARMTLASATTVAGWPSEAEPHTTRSIIKCASVHMRRLSHTHNNRSARTETQQRSIDGDLEWDGGGFWNQ
jgi:hypothetical protein